MATATAFQAPEAPSTARQFKLDTTGAKREKREKKKPDDEKEYMRENEYL
jgi:hypothetical protein